MNGCEGCAHFRKIAQSNTSRVCHYILDTGMPRSLICKAGAECTVRTEKVEKKVKRARMHKFDFTPVEKRPLNFLDKEKVTELYEKGLKDGEIAKIVGAKITTIRAWRKRSGRPANADRGRPKKEAI